jgi:primosomal protein N'
VCDSNFHGGSGASVKEIITMGMKLGAQTASLTNHLQSRATIGQPEPTVGMGATLLGWTDRYAGTIVEVLPQKNGSVILTSSPA